MQPYTQYTILDTEHEACPETSSIATSLLTFLLQGLVLDLSEHSMHSDADTFCVDISSTVSENNVGMSLYSRDALSVAVSHLKSCTEEVAADPSYGSQEHQPPCAKPALQVDAEAKDE